MQKEGLFKPRTMWSAIFSPPFSFSFFFFLFLSFCFFSSFFFFFFLQFIFIYDQRYFQHMSFLGFIFCVSIYLALNATQFYTYMISAFLMGVFWQQLSFMGHDFGHNSVFENKYFIELLSHFKYIFIKNQ
jgi:hypothetical protein